MRKIASAIYLRPDFAAGFALEAPLACAASALGRPVLMEGTACRAVRSALSDNVASNFNPARSSSLFLTGWANADARCLRVSITAYSSFGIVKLSRTNLGFLAFTSLAATGAGALAGFAGAAFLATGPFFVAGAGAGTVSTGLVVVAEAIFGALSGLEDLAGADDAAAGVAGVGAGVEGVDMVAIE